MTEEHQIDLNAGVLARNGPNPFDGRFSGEGMLHWWTGSAMLHGVAFDQGKALWYRNRWVRTGQWLIERFGEAYLEYGRRVPRFWPKLGSD